MYLFRVDYPITGMSLMTKHCWCHRSLFNCYGNEWGLPLASSTTLSEQGQCSVTAI